MNLAGKILYRRKKAGLSQEALAEKLGVSRQAVSKWETGDAVPELDTVADLRTRAEGGHGAIREAVEFLLKEQGKWSKLMERYFG